MAEIALRFGVADVAKGLRASTWKLWTDHSKAKSDAYLLCRQIGGTCKLSLHQSGQWHIAFDYHQFDTVFESGMVPDSRFAPKWTRPAPPSSLLIPAARITTPWSSVVSPIQGEDTSIQWVPAPQAGFAIRIAVILGFPGFKCDTWPGSEDGTALVGLVDLYDKSRVWVVSKEVPLQLATTPMSGVPKYFKGKSKADLTGDSLKMLAWDVGKDGAASFFDAHVAPPPRPDA